MNKSIMSVVAGVALAMGLGGAAFAEDKVDETSASTVGAITFVGGEVNLTAVVDEQVAVAIGQDVYAANSQATIYESTVVKGNVTATATAKTQVAVAIGQRAQASNHQASIGARR
jgi:hypothetical protein